MKAVRVPAPQLALHFDISLAAGERQSHAASNKQLAYQMVTSATPTATQNAEWHLAIQALKINQVAAVRLKFCLLNGLDCITSLVEMGHFKWVVRSCSLLLGGIVGERLCLDIRLQYTTPPNCHGPLTVAIDASARPPHGMPWEPCSVAIRHLLYLLQLLNALHSSKQPGVSYSYS